MGYQQATLKWLPVSCKRVCVGGRHRWSYTVNNSEPLACCGTFYIPQRDLTLFLNVNWVLRAKGTTVIRVDKPRNNQGKGVHWFEDYLDFKEALRDHTQSTPPDNAEGKEMIQTTTSGAG